MSEGGRSSAAPMHRISCERCRRRKIKCDRQEPCSRCTETKVDCLYSSTGRRRPVSHEYVKSLEAKMDSMSRLIQTLASSDEQSRPETLAADQMRSPEDQEPNQTPAADLMAEDNPAAAAVESTRLTELPATRSDTSLPVPSPSAETFISEKSRDGRMRKMVSRQATQFFGGTSLFEMNPPAPASAVDSTTHVSPTYSAKSEALRWQRSVPGHPEDRIAGILDPHGPVCRELVALFFANCYQYNHFIYREFFLRDYATSSGIYYSDMLLHAICAVGAIVSQDFHLNALQAIFREHAESQAIASLDSPDLTTLQTLMICGPLEVGQGRGSKGWLFCGMAFRLAHEMGLHLDPSNWDVGEAHSSVDREILRRVYWATFVADKQMSLYFGRPPALYPQEADVRNTIRIPYPPEWEDLIDTYIAKGTSATAFEDSLAVVGAFVHRVELAKVFHTMIVTIFEKRDAQPGQPSELTQATREVHSLLEKWLSQLPQTLQWNPWKVNKVPHYILHLHLVFHTGMIILHRPPSRCSDTDMLAMSEDIDICYESLSAILRLLSSYERHYSLRTLPLDIVHILAAAARIVFLRKRLEQIPWDSISVRKPLDQILRVMDAISTVWPCVLEIKAGVESTIHDGNQQIELSNFEMSDLLGFLDQGANALSSTFPMNMDNIESDLGFLVTDESLNHFEGWGDLMS